MEVNMMERESNSRAVEEEELNERMAERENERDL
jgi:hypothetical protein